MLYASLALRCLGYANSLVHWIEVPVFIIREAIEKEHRRIRRVCTVVNNYSKNYRVKITHFISFFHLAGTLHPPCRDMLIARSSIAK